MIQLPPPPRMSGAVLRAVVTSTRAEPVRRALATFMRKDLGIDAVRALPATAREEQPLHARPVRARSGRDRPSAELGAPTGERALPTAGALTAAYRDGSTTPVEVCERFYAEAQRLAALDPSMNCLSAETRAAALRDADASAKRWAAGAPLGPLDGVPVPIKEEVDVEDLGCRLGTEFIPPDGDVPDATTVARLRGAGALIVGHAVMTEMGMSPLGVNPHRRMPRNAHAPDRLAGGSSTGSAIAVASGLCPVALGSDGGGSIRVPSSFNGLFGIKPTFGRVSRQGGGFGGTVDHLGPIGASAEDLAIFLEAVGQPDPQDELTHNCPPVAGGELVAALGWGVEGLRVGVLRDEMAAADAGVQRACEEALEALEREGAILVDVELPLAEHASGVGYLTIGLETYAALLEARRQHWERLGLDLQLLCRLLSTFESDDYLDAQAVRARLRITTAELLRTVDVIAMPTTAGVAPTVTTEELAGGFADTPALHRACRFSFLGNLTGLPCGTAPVGSGEAGLPVGLQILGDAFDERMVLSVLAHLERIGAAATRRPLHPATIL